MTINENTDNTYQDNIVSDQPVGAPTPPVRGYLPPPEPRPAPKRGTAAMVVGAVILGSGFLTAVSGGALLAVFGDGQILSSGSHPVATSTSAMITDMGTINGINGLDGITGAPTLHISADSVGETGVFVGVGPTDEVERYLDDVATETVTDLELSPFSIDMFRNDGATVAEAPTEQDFWVVSSASADVASVTWEIENGSYQVVVMNADGSAGVLTAVEIGASLPSSSGLWILVLSIGVLIMFGGGALLVAGARQDRSKVAA